MWTSGKKPGKRGPATHWQTADWGLQSRVLYITLLCLKSPKKHDAAEGKTPIKGRCGNCSDEATGCLVFHFSIVVCTISSGQTQNQVETEELCPCTRTSARCSGHLLIIAWGKDVLSQLSPVCYVLWRWDDLISFKGWGGKCMQDYLAERILIFFTAQCTF